MTARVIPIRTADDPDAQKLTEQTAREVRQLLKRFSDPEAQELLIRCVLRTYYAQRIGEMP